MNSYELRQHVEYIVVKQIVYLLENLDMKAFASCQFEEFKRENVVVKVESTTFRAP